jgi:hypothetical protein
MLDQLKAALRRTALGRGVRSYRTKRRVARQLALWQREGRPVPPPHAYKVETVRQYARDFATRVLVETGTYQGDMVSAVKDSFATIYTIELDPDLHRRARARFAGDPRVSVLGGDSAEVLSEVLPHIERPCLFWLDAHHSGGITARGRVDTPIIDELRLILEACLPRTVILIDDARLFVGENDYPTLDVLRQVVLARRPAWAVEVLDDIIRITDPSARA